MVLPTQRTIRRALGVLEQLPAAALVLLTERLIERLDALEDTDADSDVEDAVGHRNGGDAGPGDAEDAELWLGWSLSPDQSHLALFAAHDDREGADDDLEPTEDDYALPDWAHAECPTSSLLCTPGPLQERHLPSLANSATAMQNYHDKR